MCELDIDVAVKVWHEKQVKARKEHRCSCCKAAIPAGQKYLKHFSVSEDGHVSHAKLCLACFAEREAFSKAHGGILSHPGNLIADLEECIEEDEWGRRRYGQEGVEPPPSEWQPALDRIRARSPKNSP
jgi:hypothetical protein